jgi:hypothetical protein
MRLIDDTYTVADPMASNELTRAKQQAKELQMMAGVGEV